MKKSLLTMVISVWLLSACASESALSSSEQNERALPKEAREFFQSMDEENGVHLYNDEKRNSKLVYLNSNNVQKGDAVTFFTAFEAKSEGETLQLFYETDTTADYAAEAETKVYYEVEPDKEYEVIRLYNNGVETSFGTTSGN
ncbi:hypothetical protein [Alkalicoccus daliensis]|uniref:Lipoprotein n=1 Tax=Alkalicoccus daliensis TaxID=745820 RepID=A0A1H0D075_9BACI|nr:hypothetical protein [Alkalicoccus daliensis]SDN63554.1 hypothetical protein SAMN04488053_102296 [Alkalicoccus daliensis]